MSNVEVKSLTRHFWIKVNVAGELSFVFSLQFITAVLYPFHIALPVAFLFQIRYAVTKNTGENERAFFYQNLNNTS